ncbi:hypothetical protein T4C_5411 [Trichinella pseudospiralis]|uniref:Uncharacterized protein n=1 Tax=Trichinella pseudospiralis TaxID=6337 RepID=A0A0V1JKH5_TRIPS|nr:hypothetical protein T4C_5411 [Trichinella pseudospiralis]
MSVKMTYKWADAGYLLETKNISKNIRNYERRGQNDEIPLCIRSRKRASPWSKNCPPPAIDEFLRNWIKFPVWVSDIYRAERPIYAVRDDADKFAAVLRQFLIDINQFLFLETCATRQGGGYSHCISDFVPNRLIPILSIFGEKGFSRKLRIFLNLLVLRRTPKNYFAEFPLYKLPTGWGNEWSLNLALPMLIHWEVARQ